jgi:hypothetical protein
MTILKAGTICYLLPHAGAPSLSDDELARMRGRIVEVVGPPKYFAIVDRLMYPIVAPWLDFEYPNREGHYAARPALIPISEPPDEMPAPPRSHLVSA